MARRVFISFRFNDGYKYKESLEKIFNKDEDIINHSEDVDRSNYKDDTIREYLYKKLRNTSVTIVLLTPNAINHKKIYFYGSYKYDDWMYDEIRYSLEDRDGNRCNGLIAVYTHEVENMILKKNGDLTYISSFNNLVRENMFNVKKLYKQNKKEGIYDRDYDHYCSLISWDEFINNYDKYINIAEKKRENKDHYDIKCRMPNSISF